MDILKRLLNVVTIGFVLLLVITIFFVVGHFTEGRFTSLNGVNPIWHDPSFGLIVTSMSIFIGILVFNYIVFKKITLWHK